jgi:hypothetical protein
MRRFLYSQWFFLFLAIVCLLDVVADVIGVVTGWPIILKLSFAPDLLAAFLALWMFFDLHRRRPGKNGDHTGS